MEKWERRQAHRERAVQDAVNAADQIILERSDGSVEETDFLTAEVAEKLMEKALNPLRRAMTKKDLEDDNKESQKCRRCLQDFDASDLMDGICGGCADDLREEEKAQHA